MMYENGGKNCSTPTAPSFQLADQALWTHAPQSGGAAIGAQPGEQGDCKTNRQTLPDGPHIAECLQCAGAQVRPVLPTAIT